MSEASGTLRPAEIERMFDRIARVYDPMNRAMTLGLDVRWRRAAAAEAGVGRGADVVDVCCGTGDLALELARVVGPNGMVTGVDVSAEMLHRAEAKPLPAGAAHVEWVRADATALPFDEGRFAAATIAFGLRNLPDIEDGLRELARVVRPGGRVVCLEITQPRRQPLAVFYRAWFDGLVPLAGKLFDAGAYAYLPASVRRFPGPVDLGRAFYSAGMEHVRYRLLAGGIVALHAGEVRR